MRLQAVKERLFLDGGDSDEAQGIIDLPTFLDGRSANLALLSRNPVARKHAGMGETPTYEEILDFYREVTREISRIIPAGTISPKYCIHNFTK